MLNRAHKGPPSASELLMRFLKLNLEARLIISKNKTFCFVINIVQRFYQSAAALPSLLAETPRFSRGIVLVVVIVVCAMKSKT